MQKNLEPSSFMCKIQSLISSTGHKILRKDKSKSKNIGISEKIAIKIQKNSYDISKQQAKDTFTPPYLEIAEQLQAENEQIFNSAVFNLVNIAINRKKFTSKIVDLLNSELANNRLCDERKDYIKLKLSQISKIK